MIWWPKLVAIKLNKKILMYLTETNEFIIVFQEGCLYMLSTKRTMENGRERLLVADYNGDTIWAW
jgi:hypothetical protein